MMATKRNGRAPTNIEIIAAAVQGKLIWKAGMCYVAFGQCEGVFEFVEIPLTLQLGEALYAYHGDVFMVDGSRCCVIEAMNFFRDGDDKIIGISARFVDRRP